MWVGDAAGARAAGGGRSPADRRARRRRSRTGCSATSGCRRPTPRSSRWRSRAPSEQARRRGDQGGGARRPRPAVVRPLQHRGRCRPRRRSADLTVNWNVSSVFGPEACRCRGASAAAGGITRRRRPARAAYDPRVLPEQLDLIAGTRRAPAVTLDGSLENPNTGEAVAPRLSSSPEAAEEALAAADGPSSTALVERRRPARRRARPPRRRARRPRGRAGTDRGDRLRRADRRHERWSPPACRASSAAPPPSCARPATSRPRSSTAGAWRCTTSRGVLRWRSCRGTRRCRSP